MSLSASQHLLRTGIAGQPQRTRAERLYDAGRVDALVARPHVRADEFASLFPWGVVVARLPRDRRIDVGAPWAERGEVLAGPWALRARTHTLVRITVSTVRGYPLLLTVSGHVVDAGLIIGMSMDATGTRAMFDVEPAEDLAALRGRRLRGRRRAAVELVGWRAGSITRARR